MKEQNGKNNQEKWIYHLQTSTPSADHNPHINALIGRMLSYVSIEGVTANYTE